jgi:outer membrane lipoprotein
MMKNKFKPFLLFILFLFISGCAHVISKEIRDHSDLSLTLRQVRQNPNDYKGKSVVWGGDIVQTTNQKDGTTLIEVFQRPLGRRGEPKETLSSEGRFLILVEKYLDPYIYRRGKRITVAGEMMGEKIKPLGEMDYRYPLLLSKQIYLWEDYYYQYPPPYYYYDPWWGHPFWWRFDFYYYRHF